MAAQFNIQLHYRCVFDLRPKHDPPSAWNNLVYVIRKWISDKEADNLDEHFGKKWMYVGGFWRSGASTRIHIATKRIIGDGTEEAPKYWSLRYEHPCSESPFRQWRTDIGLTSIGSGAYRLSLATTHWITPGFIGREPESPLPSAPRVVGALIRHRSWQASAGSEPLDTVPRLLRVGHAHKFREYLADSDRHCPIILVTRKFSTDEPMVDPQRLARLLEGTATVVEATSKDVNNELEWFLPPEFRCWDGMLRVYQPGVDFGSALNAKRHRFFTQALIDDLGARVVEDQIIRGITRRSRLLVNDAVTSLEDIDSRERELRLAQIRAELADETKDEFIALLEEDNSLVNQKNQDQADDIARLKDEIELLEATTSELSDQQAKTKFERDQERQTRIQAESSVRMLEGQIEVCQNLASLPGNLLEMVNLIEQLHAGRIVFTNRARQPAESAQINKAAGELKHAWRCMWAVATDLHELIFDENSDGGSLVEQFRSRTGFDLALTERKQTKKDARLRKLRTDTYKSEEIDITPHVKYGNKEPKCLRVHYHAHRGDEVIVVGHCGDHLETYGTRKRK